MSGGAPETWGTPSEGLADKKVRMYVGEQGWTKEGITKVLAALLKARKDFKPVKKESENPFFNSRYADLAAYLEATEDALTAQGLVVVQSTSVGPENRVVLNTRLYHESGEYLDGGEYPLVVSPDKNEQLTAQGYGSALTYARRYAYGSLLGLAAEDDDGASASANRAPGKQKRANSPLDADILATAGKIHALTGEVVTDIIKWSSQFTSEKDGKKVPGFTDPTKVPSEKWKKMTLTNLQAELHKAGLKSEVGEDEVPF